MRQRLGSIQTRSPQVAREYIIVNGTGTAAVTQGSQYVTLEDNGTGDYTLTLKQPGSRFLHGSLAAIDTTARVVQFKDAPTATVLNVVTFTASTGAAVDAVFMIAVDVQLGLGSEF